MIIIEGPDGGGKTTLVKQLSHTLGIPVAPKVVDSDTRAMVDLRQWTDQNLDKGFHRTIYDRHRLISEPIYSSVLSDRQLDERFWEPQWFQAAMTKLIVMIQPIVVYCMPPFATVWNNVRGDSQNVIVSPRIRGLYNAYLNRMTLDLSAFKFDYTAADADVQFNKLVDHILLRMAKEYYGDRVH